MTTKLIIIFPINNAKKIDKILCVKYCTFKKEPHITYEYNFELDFLQHFLRIQLYGVLNRVSR